MNKQDVLTISDNAMTALLTMMNLRSGQSSGILEDALMATGSVIESMY
jgi:hypothetical protein